MSGNWQQVKEVLAAALEREPGDRLTYLDNVCTEPSLRREVESVLAAHEEAETLLRTGGAVETGSLKTGARCAVTGGSDAPRRSPLPPKGRSRDLRVVVDTSVLLAGIYQGSESLSLGGETRALYVDRPTEVMHGRIAQLPKMLKEYKNGENKDGNRDPRCA